MESYRSYVCILFMRVHACSHIHWQKEYLMHGHITFSFSCSKWTVLQSIIYISSVPVFCVAESKGWVDGSLCTMVDFHAVDHSSHQVTGLPNLNQTLYLPDLFYTLTIVYEPKLQAFPNFNQTL